LRWIQIDFDAFCDAEDPFTPMDQPGFEIATLIGIEAGEKFRLELLAREGAIGVIEDIHRFERQPRRSSTDMPLPDPPA